MLEQTDPRWDKLVIEITSGIKEWVERNPKATMAEIERETMRRMSELQARMLEEISCEPKQPRKKRKSVKACCARSVGQKWSTEVSERSAYKHKEDRKSFSSESIRFVPSVEHPFFPWMNNWHYCLAV